MKKFASIQFINLSIISGIVAVLTFITGHAMKQLWNDIIFGNEGKVAVPELPVFAMRYGFLVPLACCLTSIIFTIVTIKKPDDLSRLWRIYSYIVTIELLALAITIVLYILPIIKIDFVLM